MNFGTTLIFAPHCDDETLGCGGLIKKVTGSGDVAVVCVVTNARLGDPKKFSAAEVETIRDESKNAQEKLGVSKCIYLDFPAPRLDQVACSELAIAFAAVIKEVNPRTLLLPSGNDLHVDHRAVYLAGLVAARPFNSVVLANILCYETLSETEWSPCQMGEVFRPTLFVDITNELLAKCDAFSLYQSQIRSKNHPRNVDAIKALARFRGVSAGMEYAEAFAIERILVRDSTR